MGERIALDTPSGRIGAWLATPEGDGARRVGLVVIQEIFGVNAHIRGVAERFAALGYLAIAPALFDPVETGVELGYDAAGVARGRELVACLGIDRALDGVDAAARHLRNVLGGTRGLDGRHADPLLPAPDARQHVAVIGYCWGGTIAFLSNTRLGLPAVSYYGARSMPFIHERAQSPLLFHFGERDGSISADDIAATRAAQPDAEVHVWPAGHGFNCELRADHDADSAARALCVTLDFLARAAGR